MNEASPRHIAHVIIRHADGTVTETLSRHLQCRKVGDVFKAIGRRYRVEAVALEKVHAREGERKRQCCVIEFVTATEVAALT